MMKYKIWESTDSNRRWRLDSECTTDDLEKYLRKQGFYVGGDDPPLRETKSGWTFTDMGREFYVEVDNVES